MKGSIAFCAAAVAAAISEGMTCGETEKFAIFLTAVADQLALIAACRTDCEEEQTENIYNI